MRSMTDEGVLQLLDGGAALTLAEHHSLWNAALTRLASPATLSRDAGEGRACLNSAVR